MKGVLYWGLQDSTITGVTCVGLGMGRVEAGGYYPRTRSPNPFLVPIPDPISHGDVFFPPSPLQTGYGDPKRGFRDPKLLYGELCSYNKTRQHFTDKIFKRKFHTLPIPKRISKLSPRTGWVYDVLHIFEWFFNYEVSKVVLHIWRTQIKYGGEGRFFKMKILRTKRKIWSMIGFALSTISIQLFSQPLFIILSFLTWPMGPFTTLA